MKTVILTASLFCLYFTTAAQSSYTGTVPSGNQSQPADPNGGLNSQPNQNGSYSVTTPNPTSPPNPANSTNPAYPSSTGSNPLNPGAVSPTMPNPTTFPTTPGTPTLNTHINLLFYQNPARTPKNPKNSGPVATMDGSTGKYKGQHPTTPAKKNGFATNRRTKGAKSPASRERSSNSTKN